MPVNRNALIRYKTIDKCLQNRYRQWTLNDLIEACSDALYEYEGIDKGVSRRTVQADIQLMRSDKLGYNAPIVVLEKKFYAYEEKDYSITNLPLSASDLEKLSDSVSVMKQFAGFSQFKELDTMVQKLEDQVASRKTHRAPVIDFERNDNLKGIEYLDELYQAIVNRQTLSLSYQSFRARESNTFDFYPYLLKEFRNRWFLVGSQGETAPILNLALDRIQAIAKSKSTFVARPDFEAESYFKNAIGVSVSPVAKVAQVVLFIDHAHAPYVLTKPLHHSQKELSRDHFGVTIELQVQHNFELEKSILGLGEYIRVVQPQSLRRRIEDRLHYAYDRYQRDLTPKSLEGQAKKLFHKGHCTLESMYSRREVRRMQSALFRYLQEQDPNAFSVRQLLYRVPELKSIIFNRNLLIALSTFGAGFALCKATFFDKKPNANWQVSWHQDTTINVQQRKEVEGYSAWVERDGVISVIPPPSILQNRLAIRIHLDDTGEGNGVLQIISGSHHKQLSTEEIKTITENSFPILCAVPSGGVQVLHPLLLHASKKATAAKRRRVIHLEFCSAELAPELEWAEWEAIPLLN